MLQYRKPDWSWNEEPLGLLEPEPTLLLAMLKEPGIRRQPHVWLALALNQPFSPATGRAFLGTLMRKLQWAGAPNDLLLVDPILGASVVPDILLSDEIETRRALGLEPPEDTASTA